MWRSRLIDLGVMLAVCAPPVVTALSPEGHDQRDLVAMAVSVPLFAAAAATSRRWPLAAPAVPLAVSLALDPYLARPLTWTWVALVVFGYLAGHRMARARPALWFFGVVALTGLPLSVLVLNDLWSWPAQLLTLLLAVVLPWLLGRFGRQYAELVRAGWRLADRMEREQQAVADRTRLRERARIAGDMHDSLGHDLTLLAVRAAVLEVDPGLDPRHQAAVRELREAAGAATQRLREIIGVLRADGDLPSVAPPEEDLEALVGRARDSGVPVTVERLSGTGGLPPMAALAVRRVLQEALTNAAKHAPGATVRVRIAPDGGTYVVRVVNDPAPAAALPGVASGGTGLVGLDERVRLAGGVLRAGPTPEGGFEVVATLPVAAPAAVGTHDEGATAIATRSEEGVADSPARLAADGYDANGPSAPADRYDANGRPRGARHGVIAATAPPAGDGGPYPAAGYDVAIPAAACREATPAGGYDAATSPGGDGANAATASARELALARRRVRRRLVEAVAVPLAVLAGILVLMLPIQFLTMSFSVLDRDAYDRLHVGETRTELRPRLPAFTKDGPPDGAPSPPPGQDCVYYDTRTGSDDAYRLCFADDRLVSKDVEYGRR